MEFELKYTYPNIRAELLCSLLQSRLIPDPDFPTGIVTSFYFDTSQMHSYEEKRASTYRKTKIRLRWYTDYLNKQPIGEAYWEVKNRFGTQRVKSRVVSALSSAALDQIDIHDQRLIREANCQQRSLASTSTIVPSVAVRYSRKRYIDSVTGSRVNCDFDIHAHAINKSLANEHSKLKLPIGVLEYKGKFDQLPSYLQDVSYMGARKAAFSKYESAIKWVKSNHQRY